jgi:hypothetical protein
VFTGGSHGQNSRTPASIISGVTSISVSALRGRAGLSAFFVGHFPVQSSL